MEGAISTDSPTTRVAVVTGGNKGIGLEVCRQLAGNGVTVVLTDNDEARGAAGVETLIDLGLTDVLFHQLDVTDASSIAGLADFLENRFGKLDILVNNDCCDEFVRDPSVGPKPAGAQFSCMDGLKTVLWMCIPWTRQFSCMDGLWMWRNNGTAKAGLQTNYYGTKLVTEALLPLLQSCSDARIVNVSSGFGFLSAAVKAYSRVLARRHPELRVNCVDPGYVRTDMSRNSGP